ncbi:hypothetical protein H4219_005550 [Mycoemilia scoparia]|uniref:Solute carrier family 35 member F6 n=1 Tax=Mycoemilia scoparia TaxID=417184 RepID=A0A9W8DPV3_9FUNG|nr:hypothetical protein H4219_005550 [Mycoemilia scoparia]
MSTSTTPWNFYTTFLVAGMLLTGTLNTLLVKLQDNQCVSNCDDPDPANHKLFEQPTWQTLNMFVGEALCLVALHLSILYQKWRGVSAAGGEGYAALPGGNGGDVVVDSQQYPGDHSALLQHQNQHGSSSSSGAIESNNNNNNACHPQASSPAESSSTSDSSSVGEPKPLTGWKTLLMWFPAICDICGTTLMNVGLLYTTASVYQMLRGAVVVFSGLFSVIFLRHRLRVFQWISLFLVMLGVGLVGLSNIIASHGGENQHQHDQDDDINNNNNFSFVTTMVMPQAEKSALGVTLVLLAQVFSATQFVFEELIMRSYSLTPIKAVGLEGIYGLTTVSVAIPILHVLIGRSHPGGFFDAWNGIHEITNTYGVWSTAIWVMLSIAFFNWFGLSVTRTVSATSRSTIDTCRTLFIWMVSLYLGWETFQWLQVVGFLILIYGTFVFNEVVRSPF